MVRFFQRGDDERMQCEVRPSVNAAGFDLELVTPDGQKQVEHAGDQNAMALKWLELEDKLKREGWTLIDERRVETT
jgi:hypothetical protein